MKHMMSPICLLVLLLLSGTHVLANQEIPRIEVSIPAEAVLGFPIPVSLAVSGPIKMPDAQMGTDVNPFTMFLRSATREIRFPQQRYQTFYRPNVTVDGVSETLESPADLHNIKIGETQSYVVDISRFKTYQGRRRFRLSEMEDAALLPAGEYTLELICDGAEVVYQNRSIRILLPSEAEQHFLHALRSCHRNRRDDRRMHPYMNSMWETLITDYEAAFSDGTSDQLGSLARQQLSYHLTVGKLVRGGDISAEISLSNDQDTVARFYRADMKLLQYEVAQGMDDPKAVPLRAEVLRLRPHWAKRISGLESNRGIVDYLRELKGQRKLDGKKLSPSATQHPPLQGSSSN